MSPSEFDFVTIPEEYISELVDYDAIIDVTEFYELYGEQFMNPVYVQTGSYQNKLYNHFQCYYTKHHIFLFSLCHHQ